MENRLKALEERIDALEQRLKSVMKIKLDEAEIALVDAFSKPMRKELNIENTKRTAKEMLIEQAQGLIDANKQVDMENADIAVQEQYRRNVETVVSVVSLLERY